MNLEKIESILVKACGLQRGMPVLLALSGGPDSLCLYDIMSRLGYDLVAAHLDHMMRTEASQEVETVRKMVSERGGRVVFGREDVPAYAARQGMTAEEAARHLRYRFLFEQAEALHAQAVAVAHNADDQVETVLMHFLRGAGMNGLTGMTYRQIPTEWHSEIPLIRPLLGTWREEIQAYLDEQKLSALIDHSNYETQYTRNRIRHQLIPNLEREYNPQVKKAVWRLSHTLQGDVQLIREVVDEHWQKVLRGEQKGELRLDANAFVSKPVGVKRNLIRRALEHFAETDIEFGFDAVDQTMDLIENPFGRELHLSNGLRVVAIGKEIIFFMENQASWPGDYPQLQTALEITAAGEHHVDERWYIQCTQHTLDAAGAFEQPEDPTRAVLDADRIQYPLVMRTSQPGERFTPYGMQGHSVKLSDFFINEKLPKRAREKYPLVFCSRQIVWVPGYRIADGFQVTENTTRVIYLRLLKH